MFQLLQHPCSSSLHADTLLNHRINSLPAISSHFAASTGTGVGIGGAARTVNFWQIA